MPVIKVSQKNIEIQVTDQTNLMDALIENQIPVASSCLGEGVCSKCAMKVSPVGKHSELEIRTLIKNKLDLTNRLSCQVSITTDVEVKTSYW